MKMKPKPKQIFSLVLAIVLVANLLFVGAVSVTAADTAGSVVLSKNVILQDDGTYTIDLSGYVTGQATTSQYTSYAPLDVVLVLDASSSMLQYPNPVSTYHATKVDKKYSETAYDYSGETYPEDATDETNLAQVFKVREKFFSPDATTINAQGGFTASANNKSYIIPVKEGDEIYCSSFNAKTVTGGNLNGIRVTYFKQDGTLLKSMTPAEVFEEFKANDLAFLLVPEGAYTMNVALWNSDTERVIQNRSLGDKYRPTTEEQLKAMRATILQEQIQKFADALAQNAKETGQTHKLAMVTFGGGDSGTGRSYQGLYSRHGGVNGLSGYYFTNTGMFVNGTFKNYMEKEYVNASVGKTFSYYTPLFRDQLDQSKTYLYLKANRAGETDPVTGEVFGVNDGEFRTVTYNATTNRWVNDNGTNIYCKVDPYDENIQHMFYTEEQIELSVLSNSDYKNAMTSILDDSGNFNADVQYAIDRYVARGTTHTKYGLAMANNILAQNPARTYTDALGQTHKGNQVVILFTDGDTNNPGTVDGKPTYNTIFARANDIKEKGAKLYTISVGEAVDLKWMDQISSNYAAGGAYDDTLEMSGGKYYKNNGDISLLEEFFTSITTDIITSQTSVTLDEKAVMQDFLTNGLILPKAFSFENISVSTVGVSTEDDATYAEIPNTGVTFNRPETVEADGKATGSYTYSYDDNGVAKTKTLTVSYDKNEGSISVTGFNYAENYVAREHPGRKLMVQITGVEATEDTPTDLLIATNDGKSGIKYTNEDGSTALYPFKVPQTHLASKRYIVDYAKPMTIDAAQLGGAMLGIAGCDHLKVVEGVDEITTDYGTFTQDAGNTSFTFTPSNMEWDKAASFYVLCKLDAQDVHEGVTTGENQWVRVDVLPANNVYYEDDFTGVDYTGNWTVDGVTQNGVEHPEGGVGDEAGVHGWEEGLKDLQYSDGSAHKGVVGGTNIAEVTFTFVGKGVDIYCRTQSTTGTVLASLRGGDYIEDPVYGGYYEISKTQIVDTQSVSGDYYQIPTISFMNLPYGTYTVTIRVTTGASDRFVYYLDGLRVYNPLADDSAYDEKEQNASFSEIRDLLADTESENRGAVFVDKTEDEVIGAAKNYDETEYGLYGPKNEIYLTTGQSVTFKVGTLGAYYYAGLKSPNGNGDAKAKVSNGDETTREIEIAHSSDMYYVVVPDAEGYITIENTGTGLLSITKLRVAGSSEESQVLMISEKEAVRAVRSFSLRTVMADAQIPGGTDNPPTSDVNIGILILIMVTGVVMLLVFVGGAYEKKVY